jgi:hypothetical protein
VGNGRALSFITEGDPIPRMDNKYAQVLFRLLLSESAAELAEHVKGESITFVDAGHTIGTEGQALKCTQPALKLPNCLLHRIGDTVVMSDTNSNGDGALDLRIRILREGELSRYIFANFFAYAMGLYKDLVAKLATGDSTSRWSRRRRRRVPDLNHINLGDTLPVGTNFLVGINQAIVAPDSLQIRPAQMCLTKHTHTFP